MNSIKTFSLVGLCSIFFIVNAQIDSTLRPETSGKDVAEAVVRKIKRSAIFGEDSDFTRRVAYVESRFGDDPQTYRQGYHGGIWQTDQDHYEKTVDVATYPALTAMHERILGYFQIDWMTTTWESLRTPLYSGLALRLFINGVLGETIHGTINNQSALWKRDYNRNNSLTQADYRRLVLELEDEPVCKGRMDICIILDGSGSVGDQNFEIAKLFVSNLVGTFDIGSENVKPGFVEYNDDVRTIFPVENTHDKETLQEIIKGIPYSFGGTNTPGAILRAVELLKGVNVRSGVPAVMTVLTDGYHNRGNLTQAIEQARRNEIYSFAVGIGDEVGRDELLKIAYGDPSRVFEPESFEALSEFFYRLNMETCTTPQKPGMNETVSDSLIQGERRYYMYTVPDNGMTIKMHWAEGRTLVYYSFTEEVPSSAINDGTSAVEWFYIAKPVPFASMHWIFNKKRSGDVVFIAIEGVDVSNEYTFEIEAGDQSTGPTEEPAPGTTQEPAPGTTEKPVPGTTEDPAPGTTEEPAPGTTEETSTTKTTTTIATTAAPITSTPESTSTGTTDTHAPETTLFPSTTESTTPGTTHNPSPTTKPSTTGTDTDRPSTEPTKPTPETTTTQGASPKIFAFSLILLTLAICTF